MGTRKSIGGKLRNPNSSKEPIHEPFYQIISPSRKYTCFALMSSSFYTVQLWGNLLLVEFFLLVIFLVSIFKGVLGKIIVNLKPYVSLLILAAASAFISDLINASSSKESIKGFSLIFFTAVNLCAVSILTKFDKDCLQFSLLGFAFGGIVDFFIQPSTYARSEIWKFGIGFPITLVIFVLLSFPRLRKKKLLAIFLISIVSFVSLFLGARSLGLFSFISLFLISKNFVSGVSKRSQYIKPIILIVTSIFIFSALYTNLASSGFLGGKAQSKYIDQTSGRGNIILNSRSELLIAGRAIAESPILGFGSYAKMPTQLEFEILNFLSRNQFDYKLAPIYRTYGDRIPVHSMFLQWWLWFGILGICFPSSLLVLYFKSVRHSDNEALVYFLAVTGIWNVLFSPYGESYRLLVPLTVVLLLASKPMVPISKRSL